MQLINFTKKIYAVKSKTGYLSCSKQRAQKMKKTCTQPAWQANTGILLPDHPIVRKVRLPVCLTTKLFVWIQVILCQVIFCIWHCHMCVLYARGIIPTFTLPTLILILSINVPCCSHSVHNNQNNSHTSQSFPSTVRWSPLSALTYPPHKAGVLNLGYMRMPGACDRSTIVPGLTHEFTDNCWCY